MKPPETDPTDLLSEVGNWSPMGFLTVQEQKEGNCSVDISPVRSDSSSNDCVICLEGLTGPFNASELFGCQCKIRVCNRCVTQMSDMHKLICPSCRAGPDDAQGQPPLNVIFYPPPLEVPLYAVAVGEVLHPLNKRYAMWMFLTVAFNLINIAAIVTRCEIADSHTSPSIGGDITLVLIASAAGIALVYCLINKKSICTRNLSFIVHVVIESIYLADMIKSVHKGDGYIVVAASICITMVTPLACWIDTRLN